MREHERVCEGMQGCVTMWESVCGHERAGDSVRVHAKVCEDMGGLVRVYKGN